MAPFGYSDSEWAKMGVKTKDELEIWLKQQDEARSGVVAPVAEPEPVAAPEPAVIAEPVEVKNVINGKKPILSKKGKGKRALAVLVGLLLLGSVAHAYIYYPVPQTTYNQYTAEATAWSSMSDLSEYPMRYWTVKNKAKVPTAATSETTINCTIEASMNKTDWITIDATSLTAITVGKIKGAQVSSYSLPYWRIKIKGGAQQATAETNASMVSY